MWLLRYILGEITTGSSNARYANCRKRHVDTEMGAVGAKMLGIEKPETSVEESVDGMMKIVRVPHEYDGLTRLTKNTD